MDLMNNMGEYQTKENPGRIIWEHYPKMSPEKYDSYREEGMSSLPEGDWAVTGSQRGMALDRAKFACQGTMPWKTGIFLIGRFELFTGG